MNLLFPNKLIPSIFLIYLLWLSINDQKELSLFLSFFLGLLNDAFKGQILGFTSIRFLITIYFSTFFMVKSIKGESLLVFFFSFLYFILINFDKNSGVLWDLKTFFKQGFLFSFYSFGFFLIFQIFVQMLRKKWKESIF